MRFEELNWMDVESYLNKDDRLMLVIGACEQHGYLSLLTDVKTPLALADAASQRSGVLVGPPVNFGVSPYFLAYPGTISLRAGTLTSLVEDIIRSLYRQGFRRLLLINGHGGNRVLEPRLVELLDELPGLRLAWYVWWEADGAAALGKKYNLPLEHASWMEAFAFNRVAGLPSGEKEAAPRRGVLSADQVRQTYGDGSFGGPYLADERIVQELFAVCLDEILALLKFES